MILVDTSVWIEVFRKQRSLDLESLVAANGWIKKAADHFGVLLRRRNSVEQNPRLVRLFSP